MFEPYLNLRLGTQYLAKMSEQFTTVELALAAYNLGPTAVNGLLSQKEIVPSNFYRKVLRNYHSFVGRG